MNHTIISGDDAHHLLNALSGSRSSQKKEPMKMMDSLAQMMELRSRWDSMQNASQIEPGTLCREKDGFASAGPDSIDGEVVYLYFGKLDLEDALHQNLLAEWGGQFRIAPTSDCIVAFMSPDGRGAMYFRPHTSACLTPVSAEEMERAG